MPKHGNSAHDISLKKLNG